MNDRKDNRNGQGRGPLGDSRPEHQDEAPTVGGQSPEPVEKRPSVGSVRPEDYPAEDRAKGDPGA